MPKKAPTAEQAQRTEWKKELRGIQAQIRASEFANRRLAKDAARKEAAAQRALKALRAANAKAVSQSNAAHKKLAAKLAKRAAVLEGRLSS